MTISKNDRRAAPMAAAKMFAQTATTTLRQALLIQEDIGSISAIEYLKAHDIGGDIISRVLTTGKIREGDHMPDARP